MPDRETETDEMFQNAGKKGELHAERTNSAGTAAMKMIDLRSWERLAGKADSVDCVLSSRLMVRLCVGMCIDGGDLLVTRMSGEAITESSVNGSRSVIVRASGHAMKMAIEYGKFTLTQLKACGLKQVIFCVLFVVFIRSI